MLSTATVKALLKKLSGWAKSAPVLETADQLFAKGRVFDAIERLVKENRTCRSGSIETRLLEIRHRGFFHLPHHSSRPDWPPAVQPSPFAAGIIPSVAKHELSTLTLTQGIWEHGALVVRGLLAPPQINSMLESIDRAYAAHDAGLHDNREEEAIAWYTPLQPCAEGGPQKIARKWVRGSGGVLAADSPRSFFNLLETLEQSEIFPVLTDYFGERPALSVKKTTLRRISPQSNSGWHQDGAFLGEGIRTINLWIALTDCGVDAPSMDMVPKRLPGIIASGAGDASFSWSLDDAAVRAAAGDTPPVRLHFKAGDAILFDERNMHRTAVDPGMTRERHAIEAWFFAPSCYPLDQVPILC